MNFNSIKYLFIEGIKNLFRNIFMALASIGVLTACLIIVGFSVLLRENLKHIVGFMGQQSAIITYIKDGATIEKITELSNDLKNQNNVKSVKFITKEDALKNFSKKINNEAILKALQNKNVLPASIVTTVKDVEKIEDIMNIQKNAKFNDIIEEIRFPTKYANAIMEFSKTVKFFGTILIISLILASLIIISNTIRASVFSRRREIAIMKQVGATDSFVRFPFLIEGATIGLISATIAFFLTAILYKGINSMVTKYSSDFLNEMFSTLVKFKDVSIMLSVSFLLCGMFAGGIGSLISLRRYLKI